MRFCFVFRINFQIFNRTYETHSNLYLSTFQVSLLALPRYHSLCSNFKGIILYLKVSLLFYCLPHQDLPTYCSLFGLFSLTLIYLFFSTVSALCISQAIEKVENQVHNCRISKTCSILYLKNSSPGNPSYW